MRLTIGGTTGIGRAISLRPRRSRRQCHRIFQGRGTRRLRRVRNRAITDVATIRKNKRCYGSEFSRASAELQALSEFGRIDIRWSIAREKPASRPWTSLKKNGTDPGDQPAGHCAPADSAGICSKKRIRKKISIFFQSSFVAIPGTSYAAAK